ncbi:long-chain fatty acid transport protein 2-like [Pungitius pungitius]|uniref:long-chain fatty acid transport protein 2-like n=1 Tax=Pungitius pungitius TaxID=134920 RepID=UPI002E112A53
MAVWVTLAAGLLLAFLFRHRRFLQDARFVWDRIKSRNRVVKYTRANYRLLDRFAELVHAQPDKPFVLFREETFSYGDADALSNRAARGLLQSGHVKGGDTVALFLRNEPALLWLWLGLSKLGCSAALLNHNVRAKPLLHCFRCSGATVLLASAELQDAVEEILPSLVDQQVTVFIMADTAGTAHVKSFKDQMSRASSEPLPKDLRSHFSPTLYVFTSGTTGLPKAAVVTQAKLWAGSFLFGILGLKSDDVFYVSLPLYHFSGFMAFGATIERGSTMALRSKFSTSQFWDDCRKYDVTVIGYIGETMRYLCNTTKKPNDRSHKVRLAVGNGIRADVWRDFVSRFGNVKIVELYGATDGNLSLANYSGKVGAIGRDTFLYKCFFPYAVIKFDVEAERPVRDSSGLCIEVSKGEPGLLVSLISAISPFAGYAGDLQQTEKKVLHDVLKKGDSYVNTGDLLRTDADGFFYFHDRVGDTFRWKGENVATNEVADILMLADCIKEANVYGVEVPGLEGRAGMAAVILSDEQTFEPTVVFKHVENFLPSYARPRFIRIQTSMEVTGTFKLLKGKLVEEGFNPNRVTDPLYFLDEKEKNYVPLTVDTFNSGEIKM